MARLIANMRTRIAITVVLLVATLTPATASLRAEAAPTSTVAAGDVAMIEGAAGTRTVAVPVTLSVPSTVAVDVTYQLRADTATFGNSCTTGVDVRATTAVKKLRFPLRASGTTVVTKFVNVVVCGDSAPESPERLDLVVLGAVGATGVERSNGHVRIVDDDPMAGIRVSIGDAAAVEGDSGTPRTIKLTVALSGPAPVPLTVDARITPVTAESGSDVADKNGKARRLTFRAGAVSTFMTVTVFPDATIEGNETFVVELSNPSPNLLPGRMTGVGTIIDDEGERRPRMGTAVRQPSLAQDAPYAAIAGTRFDVVTPENELKWDAVQPQPGIFNFAAADTIVDFAERHGQAVVAQTLTWWFQNPAWLTNGSFNHDQLVAILEQHIATVVGRYRNRIADWVVVNEAIADNASLRPNIWSNGIGAGYVDQAFIAARAADPNARLFINDYGVEMPGPKADALYALVASMVARGIPIDGVGFQAHVELNTLTASGLTSQIARYEALGLDVAITELDVRLSLPVDAFKLAAQAGVYRLVRDACLTAARCTDLITWGYTDRYSWIPLFVPGWGAALPWDANLGPKPAYAELAPLLR